MNSTSTEACASGWYASRYSIGPSGTTSAAVNAICTASPGSRGATQTAAAATATGSATWTAAMRGSRCHARSRHAATPSVAATSAPAPTSIHAVAGVWPSCSVPSVSAA